MIIAVFGLGYVGTVTAVGLASQGHDVCGIDVDAVKVDLIKSGRSPVVEPGIDQLLMTAVENGRLRASDGAVIDELRTSPPKWILDLHGRLGAEIERLPGYEGIGWAV